jgi:cyclic pyranopterin phosphate synthase
LTKDDRVPREELLELVAVLAELGIERVRLTGGEPTTRPDLLDIAKGISGTPGIRDVALTTNGDLLAGMAADLRAASVRRLNVSLDTLDPQRFAYITRRDRLEHVLLGIKAAASADFDSLKINVVALKGFNDDELGALCRFAWAHGATPRFIEHMPMSSGDTYNPEALLSASEIRALIEQQLGLGQLVPTRLPASLGIGPARYFETAGPEESCSGAESARRPVIGIISPMTHHFCDDCNRIRLTSEGRLHTCLGSDDAVDLRSALHMGGRAAVAEEARRALARKPAGHSFQLIGIGGPRKSMMQVGG